MKISTIFLTLSAMMASSLMTVNAQDPQMLKEMLDLVNSFRKENGKPAGCLSRTLVVAAQKHSEDQLAHDEMSHTGSDGSGFGERCDRAGFPGSPTAENVFLGGRTAKSAM